MRTIQNTLYVMTQNAYLHLENDTLRVEWFYRRLFSRNPEPEEIEIAIRFVRPSSAQANSEKSTSNGWQRLAHALLASNEFIFVD